MSSSSVCGRSSRRVGRLRVPEAVHLASGKVREIYALDDDRLRLVASDRISTFDVILPTPIPDKGRVLTGMSAFWFARTRELVPNHLLELGDDGRTTICRRLEMLPVELVVRGYLSGSGLGRLPGHGLGVRPRAAAGAPRVGAPARADRDARDQGRGRSRSQHHRGRGCRVVRPRGICCRARGCACALRLRVGARGVARDHPRRYEVRVRRRYGRGRDARRRGLDARFVPVLAGRHLRAGRPAAVVRQAVRPRLLPLHGVGSHLPRPGSARRGRCRHEGTLRRCVRAPDGDDGIYH